MTDRLAFAHYGEKRERIATESEIEIFEILKEMSGSDDLELVRKSDNYVSAVLGEWDVARIKFTPRAKWVQFPLVHVGSDKCRIKSTEDVREFQKLLKESTDLIAIFTSR